jgi:hypothetical protein
VALVPVEELSLDRPEDCRIGFDGEDDRRAHARGS